jgi:hypothetical protein
MRRDIPGRQKRAADIEPHYRLKELQIHFDKRLACDQATDNIDENIDRVAEGLLRLANIVLDVEPAGEAC